MAVLVQFIFMLIIIGLTMYFASIPTYNICFIYFLQPGITKVFVYMFFIIGIFRPTLTTPNMCIVIAFLSNLWYICYYIYIYIYTYFFRRKSI